MEHISTILVALITTGSFGTIWKLTRKSWDSQANAGYQRRVKEEQAEEATEAIFELEAENTTLLSDLSMLEKRLVGMEAFAQQQQDIIADQAAALANLGPKEVAS